jgi:hypothetical protein
MTGRKFVLFLLLFRVDKLYLSCCNLSKGGYDGPIIGLH